MMFEIISPTTPQEVPLQSLDPIGHTGGDSEQG